MGRGGESVAMILYYRLMSEEVLQDGVYHEAYGTGSN